MGRLNSPPTPRAVRPAKGVVVLVMTTTTLRGIVKMPLCLQRPCSKIEQEPKDASRRRGGSAPPNL